MSRRLITLTEANEFLSKKCKTKITNTSIKSTTEKLQLLCECGEIFETSWHKVITQNKIRCNKCTRLIRTEKERKEKEIYIIEQLKKDGNELISNYLSNTSLLKIKCSCGEIFETTWSSYNNVKHKKNKCNNCSQVYKKYEEIVLAELSKKNIKFYREKQFDDLKIVRKLKFDFYLPDYMCCIEVDEKYHNSSKGIKEYQYSDKLKEEYCRNNGIKLVRITDKNNVSEIINIIDDIVLSYAKA